jgi:hypothetical protein
MHKKRDEHLAKVYIVPRIQRNSTHGNLSPHAKGTSESSIFPSGKWKVTFDLHPANIPEKHELHTEKKKNVR